MATEHPQPPHTPGLDASGDPGIEDWEDEFGFDDRQFVVEDLADEPDAELPPAVTGAPPTPSAEPGTQGQPHAQ
ncbi:hypothetical protein ACFXEL_24575 [Streptomyces sp. NPDC059382]|uniref:hypothetical protein n=1 Tax=unclassified Streptomyces TaxID=2593676 RepID=UPI0033260FA4